MSAIAGLRYERPDEAIGWLKTALGFKEHAVYRNNAGVVEHAELTFGSGMIMLGAVRDSPFSKYMVQPSETGGRETQSQYLVTSDVRGVYAQAKAVGAEILLDLREESYGGEHFTCRDPEGHVWSVGSYDPWKK